VQLVTAGPGLGLPTANYRDWQRQLGFRNRADGRTPTGAGAAPPIPTGSDDASPSGCSGGQIRGRSEANSEAD